MTSGLETSRFAVHIPTNIHFGAGTLAKVGDAVSEYGRRCLLVTGPTEGSIRHILPRIMGYLAEAGVEVAHFDGVIPNPTTDTISAGAKVAMNHRADVILGVGGGSSMDAAKAIAVEATHPGSCWDYLFYRDAKPSEKTLPVVAVSTTSGTGSQVTQVSVVTHTETRDKSALYNALLFPKVAIVDPELMVSVPKYVTACTGFDAFTHAFESAIHVNSTPYVQLLAWEAIPLVLANLPTALEDPNAMDARSALAYADTLAGICIALAGVTLPHGMGMAIGGMYPEVAHGEALALNYPAFTRFTYASAVQPFARLGRLLNADLEDVSEAEAARQSCEELDTFLKKIGLWIGLSDKRVPQNELQALAEQCMVLPDYKNNPRIASESEMLDLVRECYTR